jgi:hypothetical protein
MRSVGTNTLMMEKSLCATFGRAADGASDSIWPCLRMSLAIKYRDLASVSVWLSYLTSHNAFMLMHMLLYFTYCLTSQAALLCMLLYFTRRCPYNTAMHGQR